MIRLRVPAPPGLALMPAEPVRDGDHLAAAAGFPPLSLHARMPRRERCHYCGRRATTRDHVVARTRGGLDRWWNLVPACRHCNGRKGSGETPCECPFCARAVWMFDLGHHR